MKSIEVEEKTVDEAINKALAQLQVSRDQASVEILEEGSRGLFGFMGAKPAKVRVTVSQGIAPTEITRTSPIAKQEQTRKRQETPPKAKAQEQSQPLILENDENMQQIVTAAKQSLQELLQSLQIEYTVEVSYRDEHIVLNIHCDNENFLIGRRGMTLDAVQYLVNRIANKRASTKIQVVLDTSDYRVKRKQRLQKLALRLSKRVKTSGKSVTISPMNPHDRRIMHLELQNDPAVKTLSRGDGFMRRVVISASSPKNSSRSRRKQSDEARDAE